MTATISPGCFLFGHTHVIMGKMKRYVTETAQQEDEDEEEGGGGGGETTSSHLADASTDEPDR